MASQSLYRKYRPQFFRDVVAQDHVRQALLHALRDDSVRHAYLFSGPRGTGKTTTARLLAKALNCLSPESDGEPCGGCVNCTSIAAGTFPDLVELDAASNNRVEEMRDLIERVHFGLSATGKRKVYIVDEVHMLTTSSSNALLKTLEEPPDHVVFVLATTDPNKVLPTIRSRTQHFEVNLLDTDQLAGLARDVLSRENASAEDAVIDAVVRRGAGSARDMLSALDQALAVGGEPGPDGRVAIDTARVLEAFGGTGFDRRVAVLEAVAADDAAGALVALHEALQHGTAPRELAEELLETLRDAFVQSAGRGRVPHSGTAEERERLVQLAEQAGLARLTRGIETLGDAIADMRGQGAPDPRLLLEVAVVRLARRDTAAGVDALRERVERLEARLTGSSDVPAPATSASPAPVSDTIRSAPANKPALGAVVRDRPPAAPAPKPETPVATRPPASEKPLDFDEVILAWEHTLGALKRVVSAAVQQANPIGVTDDVVLFGVPPAQLTAVQRQFKNNADDIRALLEERLQARVRFKLAAHDFDAPGALRPQGEPALPAASGGDEESIDLSELVDAPRGTFADDSVSLLQAELGAQVVDDGPHD